MFDIMLALDCIPNVLKSLEINESLQSMSSGEAFDEARTMLEYAADEVICHTYVESAVRTICQNVNVPACHAEILQRRGWPGQARP
jgi:hypothetical protein